MLLKCHKSGTTILRVGTYFNAELFGPMFIPFLGFYHRQNRFEANVLLPVVADMGYYIQAPVKTGFKFLGSNKSYYLNEQDQYMVKLNNEIGPYVQYVVGALHVQLHCGVTFLRNFRTYGAEDRVDYAISIYKPSDDRASTNQDFGNSFFIKTSLIYRFDLSLDGNAE